MAVAVEHIAKAYLASITLTLLSGSSPSVNDLLVLGGQEDRAEKGRSGLKTISGEVAVKRVKDLLNRGKTPTALDELREARNGVTHMGWGPATSKCRELLAAGVTYVESLLPELSKESDWFWGDRSEASKSLVAQATSELKLRYEAKIRRARANFAHTTKRLSDTEKATVIASLSAVAPPGVWGIVLPTPCPACGSPAFVGGRDKSGDYGDTWFFPRDFGCRVCQLTLTGQELDLASIKAQSLKPSHWPRNRIRIPTGNPTSTSCNQRAAASADRTTALRGKPLRPPSWPLRQEVVETEVGHAHGAQDFQITSQTGSDRSAACPTASAPTHECSLAL